MAYKSISAILVSPLNPKVVVTVVGVIVAAFGSMLFNFFYRNYGSNCVIEPDRKYYSRFC